MTRDLNDVIANYETLVRGLGEETEYVEDEALLALIARDVIEDLWSGLDRQQHRRVQLVDDELLKKTGLVTRILPNPNFSDPARWWWHLHEGKQVRARSRRVA